MDLFVNERIYWYVKYNIDKLMSISIYKFTSQ